MIRSRVNQTKTRVVIINMDLRSYSPSIYTRIIIKVCLWRRFDEKIENRYFSNAYGVFESFSVGLRTRTIVVHAGIRGTTQQPAAASRRGGVTIWKIERRLWPNTTYYYYSGSDHIFLVFIMCIDNLYPFGFCKLSVVVGVAPVLYNTYIKISSTTRCTRRRSDYRPLTNRL